MLVILQGAKLLPHGVAVWSQDGDARILLREDHRADEGSGRETVQHLVGDVEVKSMSGFHAAACVEENEDAPRASILCEGKDPGGFATVEGCKLTGAHIFDDFALSIDHAKVNCRLKAGVLL